MKKEFERRGQSKIFELHERLGEKGFITVEEAATAFDMTTDEIKAAIAARPELFKAWHISC